MPLSQNYPPEVREKFVARVNGLFGGKLAPESFVLSQAYLYGSVNNNPNHRVEVIDGRVPRSARRHLCRIDLQGRQQGWRSRAQVIDFNGAGPQHRSRKDDDPEPVDRDKIEAALNVISSDCSYEDLAESRRRASLRARRSRLRTVRPVVGKSHAHQYTPTKARSAGAVRAR